MIHARTSTSRAIPALLLVCILIGTMFYAPMAYADDEQIGQDECQILSGTGTAEDPYVYQIGSGAKVSWKHLDNLNETAVVERYERNSEDGSLSYAWVFTGGNIDNPAGPYWLEVSQYYQSENTAELPGGQNAYYFSLANKADFSGEADLILDVSEAFKDGETLALFYYGGISDQVVHGAGNPIDPKEYLLIEDVCAGAQELTVQNGLVKVQLSFGGNFFLIPSSEAASVAVTASKPAIATRSLPGAPAFLGNIVDAPLDEMQSEETEQATVDLAQENEALSPVQIVLIVVMVVAALGAAIILVVKMRSGKNKTIETHDDASS